jgi:hypothetical protein
MHILTIFFIFTNYSWYTNFLMFLALQILDLVPILAHQYFSEKLPVTLHGAHVAVLFCMGLQDKDIGVVKVGSCLISCKCRILEIVFSY